MPSQFPKYLIRFDDICPTMNWSVWEQVESLLMRFNVNPILAVIPDNKDPSLAVDQPATDFWDRVRSWQQRGWAIGLHGFEHVYVNKQAGIIGLSNDSEFAGLSYDVQVKKLKSGLEIFSREGVRADCWVAPSHSFDLTTVQALHDLGVRVVSDGLWRWPFTGRDGTTWIPQQIGGHKGAMLRKVPSGIWTICCHHNDWGSDELGRLQRDLEEKSSLMTTLREAIELGKGRRLTAVDRAVAAAHLSVFKLRKVGRLVTTRTG